MTVPLLDENENRIYPKVLLPRPPVTKDELWEDVKYSDWELGWRKGLRKAIEIVERGSVA